LWKKKEKSTSTSGLCIFFLKQQFFRYDHSPLTDALVGVHVFEKSDIAIVAQRALFTRMTPSLAYRRATQLFGAHYTLQLSSAHIVYHSGVTRTDSVIWNKNIRFSDWNLIVPFDSTAIHACSNDDHCLFDSTSWENDLFRPLPTAISCYRSRSDSRRYDYYTLTRHIARAYLDKNYFCTLNIFKRF